MAEKFCTACGAVLDETKRFCTSCGTPVNTAEPSGSQELPGNQPSVGAQLSAGNQVSAGAQVSAGNQPSAGAQRPPEVQTFTGSRNSAPPPQAQPFSGVQGYAPVQQSQPYTGGQGYPPAYQPTVQPVGQPVIQPLPYGGEPTGKYATIKTGGWIGIMILLMIPLVNLILLIIWACGGCQKVIKRSFARATLIMMVISAVLMLFVGIYIKRTVTNLINESGILEQKVTFTGEDWEAFLQEMGQ